MQIDLRQAFHSILRGKIQYILKQNIYFKATTLQVVQNLVETSENSEVRGRTTKAPTAFHHISEQDRA